MKSLITTVFICLIITGYTGISCAQDMVFKSTVADSIKQNNEALLVEALEKVTHNDIDAALKDLEALVSANPKFRLAQLVYADLLSARAFPITDFGNLSYAPYADIAALREEAKSRWKFYHQPEYSDRIPKSLVQLEDKHKYAIIVDMSIPRLYIFENRGGVPVLVANYYVSIGKNGFGKYEEGDQKTPVGVYFATGFIGPKQLPDFYGDGAFPINYPNAWDRQNGNTGYGIWLHGTPHNTYSRPPRDSDGCVIVSNQDLASIRTHITAGRTAVILAEQIEWIDKAEWKKQQRHFRRFVEQWRRDWESRDPEAYLSHYSTDYYGLGKDYDSWVAYKRRVNSAKKFIKIGMSETTMFLYPNGTNILVVTFDQDYRSNNVKRKFRKRQYWKREQDGTWRIFFEDGVS